MWWIRCKFWLRIPVSAYVETRTVAPKRSLAVSFLCLGKLVFYQLYSFFKISLILTQVCEIDKLWQKC